MEAIGIYEVELVDVPTVNSPASAAVSTPALPSVEAEGTPEVDGDSPSVEA